MESQTPYVSNIRIYPIKSLDPVAIDRVYVGNHSLKNDRAYALKTADGKYVNGKRTGQVNQLAASYDLPNNKVYLGERNQELRTEFELNANNTALVEYFSDFFGMKLTLSSSDDGDLLDVPISSSITLVSTASLQSILVDFPHLTLDDLRLRFRANIEFDGVQPFWEDQLFGKPGNGRKFKIGNIALTGISPRARCIVPTRHPLTGKSESGFMKQMMKSRATSLPKGSDIEAYGHFYHLCVNSFVGISEVGKSIRIGDEVRVFEPVVLSELGIPIK